MKGLSTSLVFFSLMFFLNQGNPAELFNDLRFITPPAFQIFFDFEKSHTDLIYYFKKLMNDMAPSSQIEGSTLSEVIFSYINFDPFSRIQGKEISQEFFTTEVRSSIKKMKSTKHENELIFLQKQILQMINGVIKSNNEFDLKVLDDISAELSQEANNIDPTDDFRKAIFDNLVKYSHETVNAQAKNYKEVMELEMDFFEKIESIFVNLIFSAYQPNFKKSYLEAFKLRALELYDLLNMLYHYKRLNKDRIAARVRDLQNDVTISTSSFDGLEFSEIDKNDGDSFNQRINLLIETQNNILKLIKPETKDEMKHNLKALRMIVTKRELERKKNDLI